MSTDSNSKLKFDFASRVHTYSHDYIRFADTKASALLASCGFIFTGILTRADSLGGLIAAAQPSTRQFILLVSTIGLSSLVFTTAHCVLCVLPRLGFSGTGMIYWEQVAEHEDYCGSVLRMEGDETAGEIARHIAAIAPILKKKYTHVRWATLGLGCTLLCATMLSVTFVGISVMHQPATQSTDLQKLSGLTAMGVKSLKDQEKRIANIEIKLSRLKPGAKNP